MLALTAMNFCFLVLDTTDTASLAAEILFIQTAVSRVRLSKQLMFTAEFKRDNYVKYFYFINLSCFKAVSTRTTKSLAS
jgi:hypothetical protein